MNKNIKMILAAAAVALGTGCVHAGTWVNGYYIDGPICTVCDGMRVVQHAYGTTVCTHCARAAPSRSCRAPRIRAARRRTSWRSGASPLTSGHAHGKIPLLNNRGIFRVV